MPDSQCLSLLAHGEKHVRLAFEKLYQKACASDICRLLLRLGQGLGSSRLLGGLSGPAANPEPSYLLVQEMQAGKV